MGAAMRRWVLILLLSAAPAGGVLGQSAAAPRDGGENPGRGSSPDEVVVRGRRLTDLRFEVEVAQERAYAVFNELNSDDDFDVYCREERRYHSRATRRTCRAQFENRISAQAATEYMHALSWSCQAGPDGAVNTQACMFSDLGQSAAAAARGAESQLPTKHEQMKDEIVRLANQDDRFAQAILDWYEKTQQYEAARRRRTED
jgi:hypothetical protein